MPDEMLAFGYGEPLGEDTRTARLPAHDCPVCGLVIGSGTREARLPGSEAYAHIWCAAGPQPAPPKRRRFAREKAITNEGHRPGK
jgi:hypothetical protein